MNGARIIGGWLDEVSLIPEPPRPESEETGGVCFDSWEDPDHDRFDQNDSTVVQSSNTPDDPADTEEDPMTTTLDFDILSRRGAVEDAAGLYIEYPAIHDGAPGTARALVSGCYVATTFLAATAKGSTWSVITVPSPEAALAKATALAGTGAVTGVLVRLTEQDFDRMSRGTIPSVIYSAKKALDSSVES